MCIGKGMFTFQLNWMSAHNSFTHWDPNMPIVFLISDCSNLHTHSQLPVSQTPLEYEPSENAKLFYPTQSLYTFLWNVLLPTAQLFSYTQVLETRLQLPVTSVKKQCTVQPDSKRVWGSLH